MKRLPDAQVAAGYTGDPELPKGSLRADHLQAREDVKRLATALRGVGPCQCSDKGCAAARALLAELAS